MLLKQVAAWEDNQSSCPEAKSQKEKDAATDTCLSSFYCIPRNSPKTLSQEAFMAKIIGARGQLLEDFQKTRNAQVLYSVAGQDKGKTEWDKS